MMLGILAGLVGGIAFLLTGAEFFVRSAARIATKIGVSPLVIGLTVVAFGTSLPELAVSVRSAHSGAADIALGNVIGSNICNVLLILGLSAAVVPLLVNQQLIRVDVPIMIGVSFLLFGMAADRSIGRLDGAALVLGLIAYTVFSITQSRRENRAIAAEYAEFEEGLTGSGEAGAIWVDVLVIFGGIGMLVLGSRWLVGSAVTVAELLGVDELVIGLTVVAVGTSLPEVATSVIAAVRGQRDIAVGNVVGSNIFNILAVLGTTAVVAPDGVPVAAAALRFDMPVMLAVSVACLPVFYTGNLIARWEGLLFLGYYVAYLTYLVLESSEHAVLPVYSGIMALFAIPLTAITLATIAIRTWRASRVT